MGVAAEALLYLCIAFAPLALGCVFDPALWGAFALSAAALGAAAATRRGRGVPLQWPSWALGGAALMCALQLVPLPLPVLGVLSRHARDLWEAASAPGASPLSLDPPATARELGKALAALFVFLAASLAVRRARGRARVAAAVALTAVAMALIGAGHALAGAERLFGVYAPRYGAPPLLTTMLNPNHASSLLGAGALAATGLALGERDRSRAALWAMGAMACAAAAVLTLSRGGILSLAVGGVTLWGLQSGRRGVPMLVALASAAGAGLWAAWGKLAAEMSAGPQSLLAKAATWPDVARMAADHALFGAGRGSFRFAFTAYQSEIANATYTHAENAPLQLCAEWGFPAALLFAAAMVWAVRRAAQSPVLTASDRAMIAALVALGVHDLADFALELPGAALPAAAMLGALFGGRPGALRVGLRAFAPVAAAAALVGAAALAYGWRHDGVRDAEALAAASRDPALAATEVAARARAHALRHPADYLAPLAAGARLAEGAGADPLGALGLLFRAELLKPTSWEAQYYQGRAFERLADPGRALAAYRRAYVFPGFRAGVIEAAARLSPALADLETVAGADLNALAEWLRQHGRVDDARAVSREIVQRGDDLAALARLGWTSTDPAEMRRYGERTRLAFPNYADGYIIEALALRASDPDRSEQLLNDALRIAPGNPGAVFRLSEIQEARGKHDEALLTLGRLRAGTSDPRERAQMHAARSRIFDTMGKSGRALEEVRLAAAALPADVSLQIRLAEHLVADGRRDDALRVLREGRARANEAERGRIDAFIARLGAAP